MAVTLVLLAVEICHGEETQAKQRSGDGNTTARVGTRRGALKESAGSRERGRCIDQVISS